MNTERQHILQKIIHHRLIAIVRLAKQEQVATVLACLVKGGVKVLEITSNTPGFGHEISLARRHYPDTLVGAGTILNAHLAKIAIGAGAQFLVTPNVNKKVVKLAHKHNIPVLMGALTPTEITKAIAYNADAVKLFPAGDMGLEYCKSIMAPFNDIPLFVVGGVSRDNLSEWLSIGVTGVGMGSNLCGPVTNDIEQVNAIKQTAAAVALIEKYSQ